MGSNSRRERCTTVLTCVAIAVLTAVIATVWVMLGQGAFKPTKEQRNETDVSPAPSRGRKEYIERTHLDGFGQEGEIVYVKPLKISPLPLHDQDKIFDQMRNNLGSPPLRHHSGHFRHQQAEVWDPHPRYEIDAFGRKLLLELEQNDRFLGPYLQITHVSENYARRFNHDPRTSRCFYTGKIRDDADSDVSVSLCNGMTGYIRTSEGSYHIEPAEKLPDYTLGSVLHRIKKISHVTVTPADNDVNYAESDQCETTENSIVEDDFVGGPVEISPNSHKVTKREIVVDYADDVTWTTNVLESDEAVIRTTRDADWAVQYNENRKSNEYFMKVLVVADRAMVRYHQTDEDLRHYILTLMSHAALLFKGATIGNSISLSVVDIWILKNRDFNSSNSQVMLKEFCEWQQNYAQQGHHDTALLLTRDTICKNSSNCNTLGVAQMGSICNPTSSCAIVKDRGLSSSYTIAHELGHVLSIPHDEDRRCSDYHQGSNKTLMSRMFQNGTKPWLWSGCSKHFVTEFLESGSGSCLAIPPTQNYITSKFADILPGETFEVDRQCELEFGAGSKMCLFMPPCGNLWCSSSLNDGCKTQYSPWAEGTNCAPRSWCHHGKCIPLDRDMLTPIVGGWGPWQEWSKCSRTCGGGVMTSERACDSPVPENGGAYCIGKSIQYASCNTQDCETDLPDFRELQCSRHNYDTMNLPNLTSDVQWVPKYGLDDSTDHCKLYCRPKNSNAYYLLKDKVIDGTKCGLNSFDICVNGICRPAGCDNRLESSVVLDECGVCGGDNSKCTEIRGNYNITAHGYHQVVRIPRGSSNLDIRQHGVNDSNYLALVNCENDQYILNGNYVISNYEKDIIFGATIIKYSGSSGRIETITTSKNHKLTKDLILAVLSWGEVLAPPDITYRYIINRESAPKYKYQKSSYRRYVPRFAWRLYRKQWSKCSSICSGTQVMTPVCIDLVNNQEQPDSFCSENDKQHQMQKQECNVHCQLLWEVASRGPCSDNCGKGVRNVYYNCIKVDASKENYQLYTTPENYGDVIDDKHCANLPKPPALETCYGQCESTRWEYSDWSECSTTCGSGTQRRSAKCVDETSRTIDESHCVGREKITEQLCNIQKCPVWSSREWTPCSTTCGPGFRTKPYYCHVDGRIYSQEFCDPRQLHLEKEECNERPCTGWSTGSWSDCSATCGTGVETRKIFCQNLDDNTQVQDDYCRNILKPNESRPCNNIDSCYDSEIMDNSVNHDRRFKWTTGAWSQCSKSCNGGISSRMVVCRSDQREVQDYMCDPTLRPLSTVECNTHACWTFGDWTGCDSNCEKRRQVSCQNVKGDYVDDSKCDQNSRPLTTSKCKISQCLHLTKNNLPPRGYFDSKENSRGRRFRWKVGRWKQCSNSCGRGVRKRNIECEDTVNELTLVDQYCNRLRKPKTTKPCERYSCLYTWIEAYWSQCSEACGPGNKTRNVTCHKVHQGGIVDPNPLPDLYSNKLHHKNYCDLYSKPPTISNCLVAHCDDEFRWVPDTWKECSHPCGRKGRQLRSVYCRNMRTGMNVPKHLCPRNLRPPRKRKCNQWKCMSSCKEIKHYIKTPKNKDYLLSIKGRPAWVHCYKMDTHEPEEYISLHGDAVNFAENYDKRLKNAQTCPYDGRRLESCDCIEVGPERSGYTQFWKVRLNITSLQIINDDFTFSRGRGKKVPYGTAGDCYSAIENCSQAKFSIDLTGTSFRLTEKTRWRKIGKSATSKIEVTDTQVMGLCGGYCGNCVPEPSTGLQVEVV